jgi:primosomal protein N''
MKLELDPEWLRTSMTMWRDAVDLKIPIHDSFKVHFLEKRGTLLEGFVKTANSWMTVLRACKAEGEDQAALESLMAEVEAFKKWSEEGLSELANLAIQESLKDNVQPILQDPKLGRVVRKSLKPKDAGKDESSP